MKNRFSLTLLALFGVLMTAAPALAVEVTDLWNELNSNAMAFKQKYVGKSMSVSGKTWVINGEVTPGYVTLTGSNSVGTMLICSVSNKNSLLPLAKGKPVTVSGTIQSVGPSGIFMSPCRAR
jgi:tRNA_anti-like